MTRPLPTWARATTRSSTSRSWLFSAFAIADSRHLRTSLAMRLRENSRSASAILTFLPRISWATRLSFCGLTRSMRAIACASLSARTLGCAVLLIAASRSRSGPLRLLVRRMAVESAGRRKLAELVADHLLRHHHRDVLVAVVDAEGQPDELRQDRRATAPGLDHVMPARRPRGLRLLEQIPVDERTFPHRTRHVALDYFFCRLWRLEMMNLVVLLLVRVFLPLVGLPQGVTGWRPPEERPSPPPSG